MRSLGRQQIFDKYSSFKSRGEREIAGFLGSRDIAYQYEYPLAIVDRGKTKIWYPDFHLPEYGMVLEYFGMVGNQGYNEQMAHKIQAYKTAGVQGIYLLPSSMAGNWQEGILDRIEQSLEGRLRRITAAKDGERSTQYSGA